MKHPFRSHILPLFTMGAGGLGLALRIWLFSSIDDKGLLPAKHPADVLMYILTALTLGILYLATREAFTTPLPSRIAAFSSMVGCFAMFIMAAFKYFRKRLPYWLPAILTVVLMLDTVAQCQIWGAVPQLQEYFFPLLASVCLILSAYYKTTLVAKKSNAKLLAFFSQSALFFCCLSLNSRQWPLYLGMLFWAAVQLFPCILMKKEA